ncbi:MAG: aspartate aminotransferase family protein [Alphaproteobacteria bacterium]|nr:MAG: aspartate aminotransferase family protein [Alphaproteobacteria bacterium]
MIAPVLPTYSRAPLSFVEGKGVWLTEAGGRRYLDLGAGIAVNALGHAHPKLVAALTEQAGRLWHVSNLYEIPGQEALARRLVDATFADTVFFTNSGTEACELAIKMVRRHWHDRGQPERTTIIAFEGAFHGRSIGAISAAGAEKLTKGFAPLLPGFRHVPFGDIDAVRAAVDETTAAIIVEPIQGEGGIRPAPEGFLAALDEIRQRTGALLIFDEVQCGMGRSGRLFAHEWDGVFPDVMMVAKGIGGGFPLGAVLATEDAASAMTAGSHGSTYGGNPLAMAVGAAVMDEICQPGFLDDVSRRAGRLAQGLAALVAGHPAVFEGVRGRGLMLGLRCRVPNTDVVAAGYSAEVLTVPGGDNVVRILPPLVITEDEIDEALARLDRAASALGTPG